MVEVRCNSAAGGLAGGCWVAESGRARMGFSVPEVPGRAGFAVSYGLRRLRALATLNTNACFPPLSRHWQDPNTSYTRNKARSGS